MSIISDLIKEETKRQNEGLELIASENYVSKEVMKAMGSILTNKYAEGYPHARYYGGCEVIDKIEEYAQGLACRLFKCKHANVQPHSGSQANFAAYRALLPNGGKIMSLDLSEGGHLTHGSKVSFSGNMYNFVHYGIPYNERELNYAVIKRKALEEKPDVILCGFSAYPFPIDFAEFRVIADSVGAMLMVDMSHIAGLVAAGEHENPCEFANVVTTTTHKTLRGPRGGMILWNNDNYTKAINSAVFPYTQGGPLEHVIAAKAVCFEEALQPEFVDYIKDVITNTRRCEEALQDNGAEAWGSDIHMFLLKTYSTYGLTGKQAQQLLEQAGITTNKNMLPDDKLTPAETSGLRIGLAALTTRGLTSDDAEKIGNLIHKILSKQIMPIEAKQVVKEITDNLTKIHNISYKENPVRRNNKFSRRFY